MATQHETGATVSFDHQVRHELVPAALADRHRAMAVGTTLALLVSGWQPQALADVVVGAGFAIDHIVTEAAGRLTLGVTRARTLPDLVGPGMRVLFCGLNPSLYAADAGVAFARPGNRFWPAALAAGLVTVDRDPAHALHQHRIGMTDLVKRASVGAGEVTPAEFAEGVDRVERLTAWLQPAVVCFVGLAGWRSAVDRRASPGPQERRLGGAPVYLAPSTSGRNASSRLADLVAHFRAADALAG